MSGVRADWFLADLDLDDSDPLDIRMVATPIDLSGNLAALQRELRASLRIEGRKYEQGLYCELKLEHEWPDAWSCRTCPHRTEDPDNPMMSICAMSMRQMDILDEIEIARSGGATAALAALGDAHGDWAVWEGQDLLEAHGEWALAGAGH